MGPLLVWNATDEWTSLPDRKTANFENFENRAQWA
jgi:hypothetical protein